MTVLFNHKLLKCFDLQIPGNFHVATHSADKQPDSYDFTHAIHEVSFGSKIRAISAKGIGTFNSLGGVERLESHGLGKLAEAIEFRTVHKILL